MAPVSLLIVFFGGNFALNGVKFAPQFISEGVSISINCRRFKIRIIRFSLASVTAWISRIRALGRRVAANLRAVDSPRVDDGLWAVLPVLVWRVGFAETLIFGFWEFFCFVCFAKTDVDLIFFFLNGLFFFHLFW